MIHAETRHLSRSQRLSVALLAWSVVLGAGTGPSRLQAQDLKMDGYPAPGAPAIVTVITPGAVPRIPLRYTVPNGYKDHMAIEMSMSLSMDMAGMALPAMQMPLMRIGADLDVTSVTASGDISYNVAFSGFKVEDTPGVSPAVSAASQGIDADYKTLKGTSTISNRGMPVASTFDFSKVTNPQLKQAFDSVSSSLQGLAMPLPDEAVGVGARWEARQAVTAGGMQTFTKTVLEVVSISGKTVTIKSTIEQSAPPQALTNQAMPPGADVRLENFTGTGAGTTTLRLDTLVPTSEATMQGKTMMQINMNGNSQMVSTATSIKIGISPVK